MKVLRNQNGSVLMIVIIAAAVSVVLITNVMSRLNSMATVSKKDALIRENTRLGDEFAKVVTKAYETAEQMKASSVPMCTGATHISFGTVDFCFPTDDSARCFDTRWLSSPAQACLDIVANPPQIVVDNDVERIRFKTEMRSIKTNNAKYRLLVPSAFAQTIEYGVPADPSVAWTPNDFDAINCDGTTGDPPICKECGGGGRFICVDIVYCPADKSTCTSSEQLRVGIMIDRI